MILALCQDQGLGSVNQPIRVLFLSTSQHEKDSYQPIISFIESAGVEVDYMSLGQILDQPHIDFSGYQALFVDIGVEFMQAQNSSVARSTFMHMLGRWSKKKNVVTGLFFPSLSARAGQARQTQQELLKLFGKNDSQSQIVQFLEQPLESRSYRYHTTLNMPRLGSKGMISDQFQTSAGVVPLPRQSHLLDAELKPLMPLALMAPGKHKENTLLVSFSSLLTALGISENFQLFPVSSELEQQIAQSIQSMFCQLFDTAFSRVSKPVLGSQGRKFFEKKMRPKRGANKAIKTAWMELIAFDDNTANQEAEKVAGSRAKLIKYLFDSGVDTLWISFCPQEYLSSPAAKRKDQKQRFLDSIGRFTAMFKQEADRRKVALPQIMIGFEIANNLYDPFLPHPHAVDIYGNHYVDVPSPTSDLFWDNEVLNPLKEFVHLWKNPEISHGIKLGGVVLDLEMYGRKKTGSFLSSMGFEPAALTAEGQESISDVLLNKAFSDHFVALQQRARALGERIRAACLQSIPNALIGCYHPHISLDWFYKGLYQGLCDEQNPLYLFTFNARFDTQGHVLKNHDINAHHSSVLMLSKVQNAADFKRLDEIMQRNGRVWINRFSRLAQPYAPDQWYTIEQTPMNHKQKLDFCKYLRSVAHLKLSPTKIFL